MDVNLTYFLNLAVQDTNQLLHAAHNILVEDWLIILLCIDAAITIVNLFSEISNLIHHNLFKYRLDYLLNPERDRAYMQWKEIAVSTQYVTLVGRQGIVSNTNLFFFDALNATGATIAGMPYTYREPTCIYVGGIPTYGCLYHSGGPMAAVRYNNDVKIHDFWYAATTIHSYITSKGVTVSFDEARHITLSGSDL